MVKYGVQLRLFLISSISALLLTACELELEANDVVSEFGSDGVGQTGDNPLHAGNDNEPTVDMNDPFGGRLTIEPRFLPDGGYPRCSAEDMRWMALQVARDRYYFKDELPSVVDIEDYTSTNEMLKAIRFEPKDRFSYAVTGKQYESNSVVGEYKGFGIVWRFDELTNEYVFTMVHNGAAREAGIRRGDRIVSVNGRNSVEIKQLYDQGKGSEIWQNPNGKTGSDFVWLDATGQEKAKSLEPATVKLVTTHHHSILENTPTKTGYLSYQRFRNYDEAELDKALAFFAQHEVQDLVVDLRLNPGGYVYLAQKLASSMLSSSYKDPDDELPLIYTDYVDGPYVFQSKNMNDRTWPIVATEQSLDLRRVYVLTTKSSCSASELFIHSLKPYMDEVVQIGTATCGKPFGSLPIPYCRGQNEDDGEMWSIINFELQNADSNGEYYTGIEPTCDVAEGSVFPWGDVNDAMLSAAIQHMETGRCPAPQASAVSARAVSLNQQQPEPMPDFRAENMLIDHY